MFLAIDRVSKFTYVEFHDRHDQLKAALPDADRARFVREVGSIPGSTPESSLRRAREWFPPGRADAIFQAASKRYIESGQRSADIRTAAYNGLQFWLIPSAILFAAGWLVAWIRRGFAK